MPGDFRVVHIITNTSFEKNELNKIIMRKLLFFLTTFSLLSMSLFGQENKSVKDTITSINDNQEHFTFLGIPINGSIKQFVKELKKQKFELEEITEVDAVLNGRFAGDKVQLLVQGEKETVLKVSVFFPLRKSWTDTKETYYLFKSILTKNYGEPKIVTETFEKPFVDGSGDEKEALNEGKCIFESYFITEKGEGMISLNIHTDMSLVIVYVDRANYLKLSEEAKKKF
jgi:hypothetical protein